MNFVAHLLFVLLCLLVSAGAGGVTWFLFTYPFHLAHPPLSWKLALLVVGVLCGLLAILLAPYAVAYVYLTVLEGGLKMWGAANETLTAWFLIAGTLLLCAGMGNGIQRLLNAVFQLIGRDFA